MKKALFAFALLLVTASAYAQGTAGCACGVPASVPTPWTIRHSDPNAQAAAQASFGQWQTYFNVFNPTVAAASYDPNVNLGNGINEVAFVDYTGIPGLDPNSVVGFTPMDPQSAFGGFNACPMPAGTSCGTINEADVWLNSKMPWNTSRPNIDTPGFAGYYPGTLIHEVGHSMGLHHNFGALSTMNYYADYACLYITQMDVLVMRSHMGSQTNSVSDLAAYPFTYDPTQQTGANDGDNALTVANVSPATVTPGGTITIKNWTMENLSTSTKEVVLLFYLSTNQTITSGDIFIGGVHWSSVGSNQYANDTAGRQFTIPANTPAGTYYVGAIVASGSSASNAVQDGITYNNTWVIPTPITVGSSSGGTPTVCTPSTTNVCLVNNRFKVSVTFNGATMNANQFTPNSGLFSQTSDPTNIEVLLKMINACSFNAKYWVYAGGTTDQNIFITVVDTQTGTTKTYNPPAGKPFQTITDGAAFNCP